MPQWKTCALLLLLTSGAPSHVFAIQSSRGREPGAAATDSVTGYLFLSPHSGQNLSMDRAIRAVDSSAEIELIQSARRLSHCVGHKVAISKTIGNWKDGAEPSILIRLRAPEPTLRYLNARLGKKARQKSVLYFIARPGGKSLLFRLYLSPGTREAASIGATLDACGIAYRALAPLPRSTIVYIVDLAAELRARIEKAASLLHARYDASTGTGSLIGHDEDAGRARAEYDKVMEPFEAQNPDLKQRCGSGVETRRDGSSRP